MAMLSLLILSDFDGADFSRLTRITIDQLVSQLTIFLLWMEVLSKLSLQWILASSFRVAEGSLKTTDDRLFALEYALIICLK